MQKVKYMARKVKRGFKAPKNYDPNRSKAKKQGKRLGAGVKSGGAAGRSAAVAGGKAAGFGAARAESHRGSRGVGSAPRRGATKQVRNARRGAISETASRERAEFRDRDDERGRGQLPRTQKTASLRAQKRPTRKGYTERPGRTAYAERTERRDYADSHHTRSRDTSRHHSDRLYNEPRYAQDFERSRNRQRADRGGADFDYAAHTTEYRSFERQSGSRVHVFSDEPQARDRQDTLHIKSRAQKTEASYTEQDFAPRHSKLKTGRKGQERYAHWGQEKPRQGVRSSGFMPPEDVVLERLVAKQTSSKDVAGLSFADLGLGERLCKELAAMGATSPFAIQAATIPDVLAGSDVLGRGRTGSGKTIAFGAAVVERLLQLKAEGLFDSDPQPPKRERGKRSAFVPGRAPKALIMAPTRELALQIDKTVQPLARAVGLFTTQVVGGASLAKQQHALLRGVDIVIGTPGRIEDLIERGDLNIGKVVLGVLDEADHMAELGFVEPVQRIWRGIAPQAQKLLFSATLDTQVTKIVNEFLVDPAVHEVADQQQGEIAHNVLVVLREEKLQVLIELLAAEKGSAIVFTRTRAYAETLREMCEDADIKAVDLHGNLNQAKRERNLQRFAAGKARVLVATDVAARGIHVDDVALVVQADPPDDYKSYLHRAGRTGRAGSDGTVVTVIPRNRQKRTRQMLENAELTPQYFGDFKPGDRQPWQTKTV